MQDATLLYLKYSFQENKLAQKGLQALWQQLLSKIIQTRNTEFLLYFRLKTGIISGVHPACPQQLIAERPIKDVCVFFSYYKNATSHILISNKIYSPVKILSTVSLHISRRTWELLTCILFVL